MKRGLVGFIIILLFVRSINARGYILAMGGGLEGIGSSSYYPGTWSDSAFKWALSKVGYSKNFVVIYYENYDVTWWKTYLKNLGHTGSVKFLKITSSIANSPSRWPDVYSSNTGIIWFPGGNQLNYLSLFKGTKLGDSLRARYLRGNICIGGTSAGAMILGEYVSTGDARSYEAIRNPYNSYLTYDRNVLGLLDNFLFDTHVAERGRIGRMFAHLGRIKKDYGEEIVVVGIDDCTAFCIDSDLTATAIGSGSVTLIKTTNNTQRVIASGKPLVMTDVNTVRLGDRFRFDLQSFSIISIPATGWRVSPQARTFLPPKGPIILVGGKADQRADQQVAISEFVSLCGSYPKITIFTLNTTSTTVSYYKSDLLAKGASSVYLVDLTSTGVNSATNASYVSNSQGFVFLLNDLRTAGSLLKGSNPVANAYWQRVNAGVPQLFIGLDCWLVNEKVIYNTETNTYNAYYGDLKTADGLNLVPGLFVSSSAFVYESTVGYGYLESKVDGLLWLLTYYPGSIGLLLDGANYTMSNDESWVRISPDGTIRCRRGTYGSPIIIMDLASNLYITRSTWTMKSSSSGPRQNGSIGPFLFHLLDSNFVFNCVSRTVGTSKEVVSYIYDGSAYEESIRRVYKLQDDGLISTTFVSGGSLVVSGIKEPVNYEIYDVAGKKVSSGTLSGESVLSLSNLKEGVYFLKLKRNEGIITRKIVIKR
ncbi:MAG: T9SS type A sorting domain-containing protein [candidate division WOR-3 bacterium]